ncbi:MAG: hypothetical protein A3C38_01540 [Planctomycetes bacterium RIFCSPHIGHO2_02_FULL_50_42]|nr:MAG: hypothetical protein A2060_02205 [Planctomycetes bacterium GWA2_50_13]OHB89352.1 MAG: hypothetical protein A3C38_01540 [Planctomycetes bacterium RIFCSPHIGHO2_02_FULL_50_42]OHB92536.1 MAG: hypothetical protein A3E75_02630 [Planctomycetes bacterium RIFCSPHIGHO2_12_FULL_51_37]OHB95459.1 MAG: hypothetical protein A3I59_07480 [Planctomycetes bacterium RIFCSPLOWO2_02_FULL_50_16]OHC04946.1 MAG: hypothetical protein A3G17_01690 [Planctomycetes bacterium RIFCSPLOWO2_12_FULL_50_35]HCN20243.1 hyp
MVYFRWRDTDIATPWFQHRAGGKMLLVIVFILFAFSVFLNVLYYGSLKGREEEIFGRVTGALYLLHGLSLALLILFSVVLLSHVLFALVHLGN